MTGYVGGRGNKSTFDSWDLSSLSAARGTYAELIRQYAGGEVSENMARTCGYLLSGILAYYREERSADLEQRLEALEKAAGL
jgi:hypothetical protein